MTSIVAVDPSLTGTGLCTWRDGRFYLDTIVTGAGWPAPARHHHIVTRALRMADGPTLYVVEDRIGVQVEGNSVLDLEQLRGVLLYAIWAKQHTIAVVNPGTLKVWATGNGKASKQSMVDAAHGRLGHHVFARDDNQADALWLCAMALHHYGAPLWRPPSKNLEAVRKVRWPSFSLNPATTTGAPA